MHTYFFSAQLEIISTTSVLPLLLLFMDASRRHAVITSRGAPTQRRARAVRALQPWSGGGAVRVHDGDTGRNKENLHLRN